MTFLPHVLIVETSSSLTFVLSESIADSTTHARPHRIHLRSAPGACDSRARRQLVLNGLRRELPPPQAEVVQSWADLLLQDRTFTFEGEVGCDQTEMVIALAAILHAENNLRTLILTPPHLVSDWRRQIIIAIPNATVCVLPESASMCNAVTVREFSDAPDFYITGNRRWNPVIPGSSLRIGL